MIQSVLFLVLSVFSFSVVEVCAGFLFVGCLFVLIRNLISGRYYGV